MCEYVHVNIGQRDMTFLEQDLGPLQEQYIPPNSELLLQTIMGIYFKEANYKMKRREVDK